MKQPEPDHLVHAIASHLTRVRYQDLSQETLSSARHLLLDCIGACIAGRDADACAELRELLTYIGGVGEASVVGSKIRLPAHAAATINATMARALEIDDVSERALLHTSATIVPATMAAIQAAERVVTGVELLAAIAIATDLANRLAWAALIPREGESSLRVMNTNVQIGVFSAAIAASYIWRFDYAQTMNTIGHAYGQCFGNQQSMFDGAMAVRVHQGLATGAGIQAARLAKAGITGASRSLEGRAGYYNVFWDGKYDRDQILKGLGTDFTVNQVSIKPYPSCKFTHTAISAAVDIWRRKVVNWRDCDRVEVKLTSREYYNLVCDPLMEKQNPRNPVEVQFSLPFLVALALNSGPPTLKTMAWPPDDEILRLAAKVVPVLEETAVDRIPSPAHVRVWFGDGSELASKADTSPGHPLTPMPLADLESKFLELAVYSSPAMPGALVDACLGGIRRMDSMDDVAKWIDSALAW